MTSKKKGIARFGAFEFDRNSRQLRKFGARVRLSKRSSLLLEELISHRAEVVSRETLFALLWGDNLHVDYEDGLNHALKRLRDSLGDDPNAPRFVERVPGVGYRFVAAVTEEPYQPPSAGISGQRPDRLWARFAIAAAAVAVIVFSTSFFWQPSEAEVQQTVNASIPVVTVLPFEDLSVDSEGGLFAVGVAHAITDELSKVGALRVTSHASVDFAGAEGLQPPQEIASRLGASHLVTGSVIRAGEEIRVTARLTDVSEDRQIWATTFDGDAGEPLSVLAEIPRVIASRLRVHVTPAEEARLAAARPVRLDVYDKYHEARAAFEAGDLDSAVRLFEETIRLDPDFAPAYSWLADAHLSLGYWEAKPDPMLKRADTAALRALQLDPTLAEPHLLRGRVLSNFEWRWEEADEHFRKAIELNPNHVRAYLVYGKYLAIVNRSDEAAAMVERAIELDPLSATTNGLAGEVYHASRNYQRAGELLENAAKLHPEGLQYQVQLACIYGGAKDFEKAEAYIGRAVGRTSNDLRARAIQAWIYARSGKAKEARAVAQRIEPMWDPAHKSHYSRAFVYNLLGDRDRAFEILDQTVENRWPFLATAIFLPPFDSLRDDPRFANILDRMGLTAIRAANAGRSPSNSDQTGRGR